MAALVLPVKKTLNGARERLAEQELLKVLGLARGLVTQAEKRALSLALNELGEIELPDAVPATADDQALVRAIATLYLASQLELAGLTPAVEMLASVAMSGGLAADLGSAAGLIADFWKSRHERFGQDERRAFFARLFGAEAPDEYLSEQEPADRGFDEAMIGLCESLYKLDERTLDSTYGSPQAHARMRAAALGVASHLSRRGTSIASFAAGEIVDTIQKCIQILQQTPIQRAFHEQTVWGVVRAVFQRYLQSEPGVYDFVRRGKAGLVVLSWLADALPVVSSGDRLVISLDHPVIAAAQEWLESSLSVREAAAHGDRGD